jgi:transposase
MPDSGQTGQHQADAQGTLSRTSSAARSASAATPGEQRRWQVIALLEERATLAEIVAATGYRPRTIREIAQRYRQFGPAALVDQRAYSPGATPILTAEQQHELREALQNPPLDGGAWTGPKVAQWMATKTGRRVHRQRGWAYLRRLKGIEAPVHADQHAGQSGDDDRDRSV